MNIDQVADQHAWITVDSKNQVWIANATEGQELRVNSKTLPAGARPVQLYHSSIIYIEGRAFRFEEETMIQEKMPDKDTPENMVVEESPVKEKHPPLAESSSPKQEKQPNTPRSLIASSMSATPVTSSANVAKESAPRVGVKRTLAQSFDEVEHSPAKRQRIDEPSTISRSAEIPLSNTKKSCLSPVKRADPKQKTLHQVRFMLPSNLIVKPHASSETELPVKKPNGNSSSDNTRQSPKELSSSESDRAPRPTAKKSTAPLKKSKYRARYVESKSKRDKPSQKKSDGKTSKRQSLISVILESSESESEESAHSEPEEDQRKKSHNKHEKNSKKQPARSDESESASDSDSEVRSKKKRSQSRSKHASSAPKNKSKAKRKHADSSEGSEDDRDYSGSDQSSSCSDSENSGDSGSASERSDMSDRSDSESESTVEDQRKDWSEDTNGVTKAAPNKDSLSSELSGPLVKKSTATEDPSSDSATTYRKTSSDILREEEAKDVAAQQSSAQQNPMANVVIDTKERELADGTSSLASSSQTLPIQLTLEERISQVEAKEGLDTVSTIDDLKAALIVVFRKLGCDRAYLIKEIVEHTLPLLPKSYTSRDLNWEIKLTDTLLVITDVIPRPNALYYRLKNEFFPKISLEQKLQVEQCESDESLPSSDSQPKQVSYPQHSVNMRDSEEILIHGSYEEIFVRLRKKKALLADITKRKMEPESIKSLKRSHGLADKKDRLLCGGLSDDEVRLVLSALGELFPKVALEFILSSLFTTAVAIVLLSRRPGTHHDDILAKIGTRCVEVQSRKTNSNDCFVLTTVEGQEGFARCN
jgi:hypothetical protein